MTVTLNEIDSKKERAALELRRIFINSGPKLLRMKELELLILENKLRRPATPDDAIPEPVDLNTGVVQKPEIKP